MVVINQAGTMVFVNAQVGKIFGYRPEDLLGQEIEMLIPERFRHSHSGHRTGFFAEPGVQSMGAGLELYGLHKNGREFPVEIRLSPLGTPEGVVVSVTIRDITVRKRAQEALQASEIRYRRLFEAAQDGIFILDFVTGQVVDVNPFLTDLLGYSRAE
jgi:protein-histidine pros-kinase